MTRAHRLAGGPEPGEWSLRAVVVDGMALLGFLLFAIACEYAKKLFPEGHVPTYAQYVLNIIGLATVLAALRQALRVLQCLIEGLDELRHELKARGLWPALREPSLVPDRGQAIRSLVIGIIVVLTALCLLTLAMAFPVVWRTIPSEIRGILGTVLLVLVISLFFGFNAQLKAPLSITELLSRLMPSTSAAVASLTLVVVGTTALAMSLALNAFHSSGTLQPSNPFSSWARELFQTLFLRA